ncbi:hypothetical protein quinque_009261 [Culex quinquefasciatus]
MGKAQSKRSVDITTDPAKDGVVTEGTGKLEKIEDVDQLKSQANGDAQHNEGDSLTLGDGDFQLQTASAAGRYLDVLTGAKRAKEERILD